MKTPDEVKKGLETCSTKDAKCQDCPYYDEKCTYGITSDSLAYIQQIEAQNAELFEKIEQLERERDAAVNDLATIHKCAPCKHRSGNDYISNNCFGCVNFCNFEWRGPCTENGGTE